MSRLNKYLEKWLNNNERKKYFRNCGHATWINLQKNMNDFGNYMSPFFYSGSGGGKVYELMEFTIIELVTFYKY